MPLGLSVPLNISQGSGSTSINVRVVESVNSNNMRIAYLLTAALVALPALAQKYEFGVHGGISFYDKKTVTNARGSADAGFNTGYAAGITARTQHVQARGRRAPIHLSPQ